MYLLGRFFDLALQVQRFFLDLFKRPFFRGIAPMPTIEPNDLVLPPFVGHFCQWDDAVMRYLKIRSIAIIGNMAMDRYNFP